jgi:hypothetical protein
MSILIYPYVFRLRVLHPASLTPSVSLYICVTSACMRQSLIAGQETASIKTSLNTSSPFEIFTERNVQHQLFKIHARCVTLPKLMRHSKTKLILNNNFVSCSLNSRPASVKNFIQVPVRFSALQISNVTNMSVTARDTVRMARFLEYAKRMRKIFPRG